MTKTTNASRFNIITESDFQDSVTTYASMAGWWIVHFRPARTKTGWQVAGSYRSKGWPDLIMVRPPRVVIAELKSERGRLSDEQREWIDRLKSCDGIEVYVWRPSQWHDLAAILAPEPVQLSLDSTSLSRTIDACTE